MKKVLITWWASGLWLQLTLQALSKNYYVDIIDIALWDIETLSEAQYKNMTFLKQDISQLDQWELLQNLWVYDMVICNAGISLSWDFKEHSKMQTEKVFQINTLGHIELIRILLKHHKIRNWGTIGCIISASEFLPFPIALWYAASKGALASFARALRSYLVGKHISVSCVFPWPMPTAHVKYYGKEIIKNIKTQKKVAKIAHKIFSSLQKRKRNIYPDIVSKMVRIMSPFQYILERVMYHAYKKDFK